MSKELTREQVEEMWERFRGSARAYDFIALAKSWMALQEDNEILRAAAAAAEADARKMEGERDALRETVRRLNRRCQEAEAALPAWEKIATEAATFKGGNFGRAMLAYGIGKAWEERDALMALCRAALEVHEIRLTTPGESISGREDQLARDLRAALIDSKPKGERPCPRRRE